MLEEVRVRALPEPIVQVEAAPPVRFRAEPLASRAIPPLPPLMSTALVSLVLPMVTAPVLVPVLMLVAKLELALRLTAAPVTVRPASRLLSPEVTVRPPPKEVRPVPTVKVLLVVTEVLPLRLTPPLPDWTVVVEVPLVEPRVVVWLLA
jgi:hypothetical protein